MEDDSLIGKQLGAYLIQAKLGEGGMARVYKAYHARLHREVAIKVILSQIADEAGFQARFEREAQLIASLEHPNIVAVYDFGEVGNLTYLVMQYVGGGTLRDQLLGEQPLDPKRAAQYALQLARALHHAHLHGIVHRDVKPQNMLVSASDSTQLLLSDFGIAKLFIRRQEATLSPLASGNLTSDSSLTNVGQIVGTAQYMAPEQIQGKAVDARTDVYALGIVLYQMLTGQVPFHSTTADGLYFQHVYTIPKPIREANPNVPEILAQITAKAIAKAPEDRFQSAEAMARELEAALSSITNPFSTPLPLSDHYLAPGSPSDYRTPLSRGQFTGAPQSFPSAPGVTTDGQPSAYGTTPRTEPPLLRSTSKLRVSYLRATLLILLGIGVILVSQHIFLSGPVSTQQTASIAQAFTEDFHSNDRGWTAGNIGHLTAVPGATKYTLSVDNIKQTYFPYPSAIGALPANFTLTAKIAQTRGSSNIFYGLAFRFKQDEQSSPASVSCYAFIIDGSADYEVLKYLANRYTSLWQGKSSAIQTGLNQSNTLQVSVQSSKFSFEINGQLVQVELNQKDIIAYTGGQLALLVAGPDSSFDVTSVQLAIP